MMTQTQFDGIVMSIVSYGSKMSEKVVALRRQSDPAAYKREEELMMLQNLITALAFYDLSSGILDDVTIRYYHELATDIVQHCPF